MSALHTTLRASATVGSLAHPTGPSTTGPSAGPAVRLLAAVALVSAAAGCLFTLAFARLPAAVEVPSPAPAVRAAPVPAASPGPSLSSMHEALRDRDEPPIELPPAF